jgi:hypothetical protein
MNKKKIILSSVLIALVAMSFTIGKISNESKLEEKCVKVQYNCDGKVFTEIVSGTTYEDAKKKAQNKYPTCKMHIINQSCK